MQRQAHKTPFFHGWAILPAALPFNLFLTGSQNSHQAFKCPGVGNLIPKSPYRVTGTTKFPSGSQTDPLFSIDPQYHRL